MRKLSKDDRGRIAEKIMELGNFIFLGLVVVQILPKESVDLKAMIVGTIVLAGAYYFSYKLMKGGGK